MRVFRIEIDEQILQCGERIPFRSGGFFRLFAGTRTFDYVPAPYRNGWKFGDKVVFAFISFDEFVRCIQYALDDDSKFQESVERNRAVAVEYEVEPMHTDHVQVAFDWRMAQKISELPLTELIATFP